jgi:hypothetical protein
MGVANLATVREMRAALRDPGMFGPGLLINSRRWSRGEEPNSQRGAKQKGEKEIPRSKMQGQMTRKNEFVSTTPEETGIASMLKLAASSMKAPKGGVGGGKRKGSSTLLAAKASPKKKPKNKPAKSGKNIASMVMRDLNEMFKQEKEERDDASDEKGDLTLFNLVRGESKKRVNFLVTLTEGGKEYVPTRVASMMIQAVGGKEKFKPKRSRSEGSNNGSSSDEEEKPPTHTHFLFRLRLNLPRAFPLVLRPRRLIRGAEMGLIGHHLTKKSNRENVQFDQISKLRLS